MPDPAAALPGRSHPLPTADRHFVNGGKLQGPYPEGSESIVLGLGCFWGAERKFWQLPEGVVVTAVGYAAGYTPNPTYEEVCSGLTGHNEVVLVVFDPRTIPLEGILKIFFESHNPTQGYRQGNDVGTQYRSGIYTANEQQAETAQRVKSAYGEALRSRGYDEVTTEIEPLTHFYFAEEYHQQYLAKNPSGYCGLGGTGVSCPVGLSVAAE